MLFALAAVWFWALVTTVGLFAGVVTVQTVTRWLRARLAAWQRPRRREPRNPTARSA